jgi:disulfide oxidoreductase YuzD
MEKQQVLLDSMSNIKSAIVESMNDPNVDNFKAFVEILKMASMRYSPNSRFSLYSYMRTQTKKKFTENSDQYRYLKILARSEAEKKAIVEAETARLSDINNNITTFTNEEFNKLYRSLQTQDLPSQILLAMLVSGARMIEIISDEYKFNKTSNGYISQNTAKTTKNVVKPLLKMTNNDFQMLLTRIRGQVPQNKSNIELNTLLAGKIKYKITTLKNRILKKSHNMRSIYVAYVIKNYPNEKKSDERYIMDLLGHQTSGSLLNYTTYRNV